MITVLLRILSGEKGIEYFVTYKSQMKPARENAQKKRTLSKSREDSARRCNKSRSRLRSEDNFNVTINGLG